jgi:serine phosphatase RsbU (regulator of sigma subunit)
MEMKDYEKAIPLLTEGVAMVHNLRLRSYEWEAMKNLAFCYSATGNHKLAALLYPKALEIKDTIYREESSEQIAQMEALYQTQKDGKVKLLEQEAEINELQLRKRATYLAAAAAITFLLGIMSLMAFFAYRSKSKINSILERKNHLIEAQKKEITDSIRYAENIQRALLPHADVLQAVFPDSFLIHRPKDIVSGDFYWIYDFPDRVYFAVVDCTGHGVPGAFMSFIGTSALNRAITDLGLITPSDILSSLSDQVSETLRSGQGADVKDGMDLALCCYFKQTGELHYAGAYNPLWVMRNGEMEIIRANKQPVGNMSSHSPFTNHILNVSAGDAVYLFSDGFADQFGGAHDKRIGSAKFRSTLLAMKTKSLKEQGIALAAYFDAWKGTAEQVDDVCVMGVRF